MRFQERDGQILNFIQANDGLVALAQLHRKFWSGKTLRAVQKRVQKLCAEDYLARPSRRQYRTRPVPTAVVWLGWRGILTIAEQRGVPVEPPGNPDAEHQLKKLAKDLRKRGIRWHWRPRWGKLEHDLRVVDFRMAVEEAAAALGWLTLEEWVTESTFRANMDTVTYEILGKGGRTKKGKRGVIPDAYFAIADHQQRARGGPYLARFLLELDMANHSNPTFARDKVAPYSAYINSPQYRDRFGANAGRWLVVTTGEERMRHLMGRTDSVAGRAANLFRFTLLADVEDANVLTDPIWRTVGPEEPMPLLTLPGPWWTGRVGQRMILPTVHG